ncbi:MAG: sulfide/dihydroorotate dehydrogenase-like FAD/NAD-binding protein [Eubacteriales bacterium]|nr:sulfide/dihydroorotate dehydrogenase-like FAD/NAD-binding protein [Eubacteriales bacterium]
MYKILSKRRLNSETCEMEIESKLIARKAKPGQFIIFRVDDDSERIPLTIAGTDPERNAVRIIFQMVGEGTMRLGELEVGDAILDFVGPLGKPSHLDEYKGKRVAVIGGGLGAAIAYPQAAYLHKIGAQVDMIVGFRNQDIIILEDEMKAASDRLFIITDDGSNGRKGFVTNVLQELLDEGTEYDAVIAVGPLVMMRAVAELTRPLEIPTLVSMNTIMVDGTGMCGCCRVTVGGETKFACVDGPDFDGHLVDFEEAIRRSGLFKKQEQEAKEEHICRLTGGKR